MLLESFCVRRKARRKYPYNKRVQQQRIKLNLLTKRDSVIVINSMRTERGWKFQNIFHLPLLCVGRLAKNGSGSEVGREWQQCY